MKTKILLIAVCTVALVSACSGNDDQKVGSSPDGGAEDASQTSDGSTADATSDSAGDVAIQPDAPEPDADSPDSSSDAAIDAQPDAADMGSVCDGVRTDLAAQRLAVGACERASQCGSRFNPTCPDGGCYVPHNVSADLSALETAEAMYETQSCGSVAVCDCAAPPTELACNAGQCGACPQACPYVCNLDCTCSKDACGCDLPVCAPSMGEMNCADGAARIAEARDDARGCTEDSDCIVDTSPLCPEVGCYFVRNSRARRADLDAIVGEYIGGGCNLAVCACAPPPTGAARVDGLCQGVNN